jgi:hypothetical protein
MQPALKINAAFQIQYSTCAGADRPIQPRASQLKAAVTCRCALLCVCCSQVRSQQWLSSALEPLTPAMRSRSVDVILTAQMSSPRAPVLRAANTKQRRGNPTAEAGQVRRLSAAGHAPQNSLQPVTICPASLVQIKHIPAWRQTRETHLAAHVGWPRQLTFTTCGHQDYQKPKAWCTCLMGSMLLQPCARVGNSGAGTITPHYHGMLT